MKYLFFSFFIGICSACNAQPAKLDFVIEKTILTTGFDNDLDSSSWVTEIDLQPQSSVYVRNGKLYLDTKGGVAVWYNKMLEGNILVEYKRTVLSDTGVNDRVSDLNNFWMATDPRNANLFTRSGVFNQYDSLQMYYTGMGGNTNRTTRFRKYMGSGERRLLQEYTDKDHLLIPNKEYTITIIVLNGTVQYLVNGEVYFSYKDHQPLTKGYFGFRSTKSRQVIDDVVIYNIK